jgi:hypothetical protein
MHVLQSSASMRSTCALATVVQTHGQMLDVHQLGGGVRCCVEHVGRQCSPPDKFVCEACIAVRLPRPPQQPGSVPVCKSVHAQSAGQKLVATACVPCYLSQPAQAVSAGAVGNGV